MPCWETRGIKSLAQGYTIETEENPKLNWHYFGPKACMLSTPLNPLSGNREHIGLIARSSWGEELGGKGEEKKEKILCE